MLSKRTLKCTVTMTASYTLSGLPTQVIALTVAERSSQQDAELTVAGRSSQQSEGYADTPSTSSTQFFSPKDEPSTSTPQLNSESVTKDDDANTECAICYDSTMPLIEFEGACCDHKRFCQACSVQHVLAKGKNCPLCRERFNAGKHAFTHGAEKIRLAKRRPERRAEEAEVYANFPRFNNLEDTSNTKSKKSKGFYVFETAEQLQAAVRAYIEPNSVSKLNVKKHYGEKINDWDVSLIQDFSQLFQRNGESDFNEPINDWDVSSATDMYGMFAHCYEFNQPLDKWNTANVTSMTGMFFAANKFDQDIGSWNTHKVTTMESMFIHAYDFNNGGSPSINNWNTSKVTNMSELFNRAQMFNQPIGNWNTSKVETMLLMFFKAESFNQSIENWDTKNVEVLGGMFRGASAFNHPLITKAKNPKEQMFLNKSDTYLSKLDSSKKNQVGKFGRMFRGDSSEESEKESIVPRYDVSIEKAWDTSKVVDLECMFYGAKSFNQDVSSWDVSQVTSMIRTFKNATQFNNGGEPLRWNTSKNLTSTGIMFYKAVNFEGKGVNDWDTISNVTDMQLMFAKAPKFSPTTLENWNPKNLKWAHYMFLETPQFDFTAILKWKPINLLSSKGMFFKAGSDSQALAEFQENKSNSGPFGTSKFINSNFFKTMKTQGKKRPQNMIEENLQHPDWDTLFKEDIDMRSPEQDVENESENTGYNPPYDLDDFEEYQTPQEHESAEYLVARAEHRGENFPYFDSQGNFIQNEYDVENEWDGDEYNW